MWFLTGEGRYDQARGEEREEEEGGRKGAVSEGAGACSFANACLKARNEVKHTPTNQEQKITCSSPMVIDPTPTPGSNSGRKGWRSAIKRFATNHNPPKPEVQAFLPSQTAQTRHAVLDLPSPEQYGLGWWRRKSAGERSTNRGLICCVARGGSLLGAKWYH